VWSLVVKICCVIRIKLNQFVYENIHIITILLRKWCHNNKYLSKLAHGGKTAGIDTVWRNYVIVTICKCTSQLSRYYAPARQQLYYSITQRFQFYIQRTATAVCKIMILLQLVVHFCYCHQVILQVISQRNFKYSFCDSFKYHAFFKWLNHDKISQKASLYHWFIIYFLVPCTPYIPLLRMHVSPGMVGLPV